MTRLRRVLCVAGLLYCFGVCLPARAGTHGASYSVYSRLSCFNDSGVEYSGLYTTWGRSAGASWDIPLFSTVIFPGGESRVIEDRGLTPWGNGTPAAPSWTDVYSPDCVVGSGSWPVSAYGDYAWLIVVPPE